MSTLADKIPKNNNQSVASENSQKQEGGDFSFQFLDNRPEAIAQRKLLEIANKSQQISQKKPFQGMVDNRPQANKAIQLQAITDNYSGQKKQRSEDLEKETIQKKASPAQNQKKNNTGLPDNLKTGMENLSGISLDDVKVHRNSDKPAQLQAHAYAQGTDIHLGSGQEKHLPHETWHVVQQKQGRVKPTMQMKGEVNVNDDVGLEKEADVMGAKSIQLSHSDKDHQHNNKSTGLKVPAEFHLEKAQPRQLQKKKVKSTSVLANIVLQPAWKTVEKRKGYRVWDDESSGLIWWYNEESRSMYFEVKKGANLGDFSNLAELAGEENAQSYEKWLQVWEKFGLFSKDQVGVRLQIEEQTKEANERNMSMDADRYQPGSDYDAEDRMALASFLDQMSFDDAMQYLGSELGDYKIPMHLAELGSKAGFSIVKAKARKILPERQKGMARIKDTILSISSKFNNVLSLGASKDFAFPYLFTGGNSECYYLVGGEIGSAESLRKTIMLYTPQFVPKINVKLSTDKVKEFAVEVGKQSFVVLSFDMSYAEFFKHQKEGDMGIPKKFNLIMDQMAWLTDKDDKADHMDSLEDEGILISDGKLAGSSDVLMSYLLGLEKIFQGKETEEENYGYSPASVYLKTELLPEKWNKAVAVFYGTSNRLISSHSPDRLNFVSNEVAEKLKPALIKLLDVAREIKNVPFIEELTKLVALVPDYEKEESDEEEETALPETMVKSGIHMTMAFDCDMMMAVRMNITKDTKLKYKLKPNVYYEVTKVNKEAKEYTLALVK